MAVVEGINLRLAGAGDDSTTRNLLLFAFSVLTSLSAVLFSAFEERAMHTLFVLANKARSSVSSFFVLLQRTKVHPESEEALGSPPVRALSLPCAAFLFATFGGYRRTAERHRTGDSNMGGELNTKNREYSSARGHCVEVTARYVTLTT